MASEPAPPAQQSPPKKEPVDLISMGNEAPPPPPSTGPSQNVFDLLGSSDNNPQPQNTSVSPNAQLMSNNYMSGAQQNPPPMQNITLETTNFQTGQSQPFQSNVLGNINLSNNYMTENVFYC